MNIDNFPFDEILEKSKGVATSDDPDQKLVLCIISYVINGKPKIGDGELIEQIVNVYKDLSVLSPEVLVDPINENFFISFADSEHFHIDIDGEIEKFNTKDIKTY